MLLLTGFLATILMRVLKKDFVKYTRDDEGKTPSVRHIKCMVRVSDKPNCIELRAFLPNVLRT